MPRISYIDPNTVDEESKAILERARLHGVPRPESQAVRAHVPAILKSFTETWYAAISDGALDHKTKEMCRLYISKSVQCEYCGGQRSASAKEEGLSEADIDEILLYPKSDRFSEREKTALRYADAIAWNADFADDELWSSLHRHFSEPQLVELGYFIALTLGQQRWIRTMDLKHREVLGDTVAGLAEGS
jgi:AhpD family alkylhydroperoxidase